MSRKWERWKNVAQMWSISKNRNKGHVYNFLYCRTLTKMRLWPGSWQQKETSSRLWTLFGGGRGVFNDLTDSKWPTYYRHVKLSFICHYVSVFGLRKLSLTQFLESISLNQICLLTSPLESWGNILYLLIELNLNYWMFMTMEWMIKSLR